MKILVIEDNPRLAERIKQQLQKWYIVENVYSGDEGLRFASTNTFDLVILDLGLPDTTGLEVCKQIRLFSNDLPILVLTGIDDTVSKVQLLEHGADDYMTKPFEPNELLARLTALSRRRKRSDNIPIIKVGDLVIDPSRRRVNRSGKDINLRRKEFDILEYLASNAGRVLSREMIINHAWPTSSASWSGSVDVHIKQIRDKVDRPFATQLIKTSYGVGYSLEPPVLKP